MFERRKLYGIYSQRTSLNLVMNLLSETRSEKLSNENENLVNRIENK